MTKTELRKINGRSVRRYLRKRHKPIYLKRLVREWGNWHSTHEIEICTHNFKQFVDTIVHESLHDMYPRISHAEMFPIIERIKKRSNKRDIAFFLRRFVKLMRIGKNGPYEPG